jgi:hypothetical protein
LATALVNSSGSYVKIVSGVGSGSDSKKLFMISQLIIATRLSTILTGISLTCLMIQGTEQNFKYC